MKYVKLLISFILAFLLSLTLMSCGKTDTLTKNKPTVKENEISQSQANNSTTPSDRISELLAKMTLEEKIGQMVQAERRYISPADVKNYFLGSILSGGGSSPEPNTPEGWQSMLESYQAAAASTRLGIPIIYGVDALHGHNNVSGAVIFPHNIGLGAANDPDIMMRIGEATAEEMLSTGVTWTFAPCVAVAQDERWGRTYESYSEDTELVGRLCSSYIDGIQRKYNIAATAKHYVGDGGTKWGTGTANGLIDRGNTIISEENLRNLHLLPYKEAINAGVKTIMVSFSSFNGLNMHEHKYLINDVLKNELKFSGFVVSDWEGTNLVNKKSLYDKIVASVNSGIDMLMEPTGWKKALVILKEAVQKGDIKQERINDAVGRILKVKFELGLFDKPLGNTSLVSSEFGSSEHKEIAREAVRKSLVLLKNEGILPLKKDAKLFVTGPAADDTGIQCGGWTSTWQGLSDKNKNIIYGSSILDGFVKIAGKNKGEIITDKSRAKQAEAAVVIIGEKPYAEWEGDDGSLDLYSKTALEGNRRALEEAQKTGLPIVVILVSGRPRIITNELKNWDALVAAWLPGSEGESIAEVLYGDYDFNGRLPFTWPKSVSQIPVNSNNTNTSEALFPFGYGLKLK